jgi:hypothetical protein
MSDSQWDLKMKAFLKKAGEDFKRFGNDVKVEAQKLMSEVQDPARQEKLREGLKDVGVWARKAAEDVAKVVETGVKKAEETLVKAGDKVNDFVVKPMETAAGAEVPPPAKTPPSPPPEMDAAEGDSDDETEEVEAAAPAAKKPAKKTVGKGGKKSGTASAKKAPAKKTIGKK